MEIRQHGGEVRPAARHDAELGRGEYVGVERAHSRDGHDDREDQAAPGAQGASREFLGSQSAPAQSKPRQTPARLIHRHGCTTYHNHRAAPSDNIHRETDV